MNVAPILPEPWKVLAQSGSKALKHRIHSRTERCVDCFDILLVRWLTLSVGQHHPERFGALVPPNLVK